MSASNLSCDEGISLILSESELDVLCAAEVCDDGVDNDGDGDIDCDDDDCAQLDEFCIPQIEVSCENGEDDDGDGDIDCDDPDCLGDPACEPQDPTPLGVPCDSDEGCVGNNRSFCFAAGENGSGWTDGYCSEAGCEDDTDCGGAGVCAQTGVLGAGYCLLACDPGEEPAQNACRDGYACQDLAGDRTVGACLPACVQDADCGTGGSCNEQTGQCETRDDALCSDACGYIARCVGGICDDSPFDAQACARECALQPGVFGANEIVQLDCPAIQEGFCAQSGMSDACMCDIAPRTTPVGEACDNDDAMCGADLLDDRCFSPTAGWEDGYCSSLHCRTDGECGDVGRCVTLEQPDLSLCVVACELSNNGEGVCREGYACQPVGETAQGACLPACQTDDDCGVGRACGVDTGQCVENPNAQGPAESLASCQRACEHLADCTGEVCMQQIVIVDLCAERCSEDPLSFLPAVVESLRCDEVRTALLQPVCSDLQGQQVCDCRSVLANETNAGAPCEEDDMCDGGVLSGTCLSALDFGSNRWTDGYCLASSCVNDAQCGDEGVCLSTSAHGAACFARCNPANEGRDVCRQGYVCQDLVGDLSKGACFPPCQLDQQCGPGGTCDFETGICF